MSDPITSGTASGALHRADTLGVPTERSSGSAHAVRRIGIVTRFLRTDSRLKIQLVT